MEQIINEYKYLKAFTEYNSKMYAEQIELRIKLRTVRMWHTVIILLILFFVGLIDYIRLIGG